ncbi:MAG: universal stress protein [Bacteroidetes bacterium]|jgi:nucleotide-binding universal stress UspA family protein|nr:universal stress protein [Bacteroidota bacterium]
MLHIRRILHPTDFSSCAKDAFLYALHLAHMSDAQIDMLHVARLEEGSGTPEDRKAYYQQRKDDAEQRMYALLSNHHSEGDRVTLVHRQGASPSDEILAYADNEGVDLIVMGTRGRRVVRPMLLGSVAQEVVRFAHCPVMTAPAPEDVPLGDENDGPLLTPFDFSEPAQHALQYAIELAVLYQSPLEVLHVIDPIRYPGLSKPRGPEQRDEEGRDLEAAARGRLNDLRDQFEEMDVPVKLSVVTGYPPLEIVEYAQQRDASMIVMASHGLAGAGRYDDGSLRMPLGSVTERVVRGGTCPVFVAKPYGKSLLSQPPAQIHERTSSA